MINKPAIATNRVTVRDEVGQTQLIASSSREVIALLVTSGGAASAVRVYDSDDVTKLNSADSILIAANTGESTAFTPSQLIPFKRGIVVVFEQGFGNNAELFILLN